MPNPIHILHVVSRMDRGGAEIRTMEILRRIDPERFRFDFCALSGRSGEFDDEIRRFGGTVHLLPCAAPSFPQRFQALLRQQAFDVVHSHVLYFAGAILRLAAQAGVPERVAFFRSSGDGRRGGLRKQLYCAVMRRWIARYATHIEAVSEGAMRAVWGPRWESDPRCRVIYDGLETSVFDAPVDSDGIRREFALPAGGPLYIHAGRMSKPKNHLRLLAIFAELAQRQPAARLLLVGREEPPIAAQVRRYCAARGIDDRVVICGERRDVPRLLGAADAMIFPSLWEGLPGAVLEGCAAGLPVVASDLPGVREIARRQPQVRPVPLGVDDRGWAEVIEQTVEQAAGANGGGPLAATTRNRLDPAFTIEECLRAHCQVWEEARLSGSTPEAAKPSAAGVPQPAPARIVPGFRGNGGPARRELRILHLHGRMGRGGAEMRTVELMRRLDGRRWRFDFCALSGRPGELDAEIRARQGRVYYLRQGQAGFPARFRELLLQQRYDVVHSHLHYLSGYLLRLAAECGVGVRVVHFRSSRADRVAGSRHVLRWLMRPWVERFADPATLRRWTEQYATQMVGVSRWALRCAIGPAWEKDPRCRLVYDGIDPGPFTRPADGAAVRREFGVPEDAACCVHVGRMTEAKNHPRLMSIFIALTRRRPDARLLLVGREDRALGLRLRRMAAEAGILEQVVFVGERSDVPRILRAADVLIFPSLWEGLGDVVLEAAAAGTPAVCSDLPSIAEIAERLPGIHLLSLAEPDVRWAGLLDRILANPPGEEARQAALARFTASTFHVDHSAGQLLDIWSSGRRLDPQTGGADG